MKDQIIGHRKKQKAETYNLIFESAKSLFEENGFEKTTMKKIAARVQISPGAIFKHFENKSALLAATLFYDLEIVQEKAFDQISQKEPLQKQFLSIAKQFFNIMQSDRICRKFLLSIVFLLKANGKRNSMIKRSDLLKKRFT